MAEPSFSVIPIAEMASICGELSLGCIKADTRLDWSPKRAVVQADFSDGVLGDFDAYGVCACPAADKLSVGDQKSGHLRRLHQHSATAGIGTQTKEVSVCSAVAVIGKLVPDPVAKTEKIDHIMPIGARQFKGHAVDVDPLAIGVVRTVDQPEGPVVDIFDMTDIVALIDEKTSPNRVTGYVTNQVTCGTDKSDSLVGIEEATVDDSHVVGVVDWIQGIRNRWNVFAFPLGVDHGDSLDYRVRAGQGNKCRTLVRASGSQEDCAIDLLVDRLDRQRETPFLQE